MSAIRIHKIDVLADNSLKIAVHGGHSNATYVRGILNNEKGVTVSEPAEEPGMEGVFSYLVARGTAANPLTKARAIELFAASPHVQVIPVSAGGHQGVRRHSDEVTNESS